MVFFILMLKYYIKIEFTIEFVLKVRQWVQSGFIYRVMLSIYPEGLAVVLRGGGGAPRGGGEPVVLR